MATDTHGFDDDFLATMLGDFLDESQGYLSRLNENLLVLDELVDDGQAEFDLDMLNEMFRDAHSLKGLSGMLQLVDINRLTHRIENIFDAARCGRLRLTRRAVDLVFDGLDKLTHMVERLKDPSAGDVEYEPVVEGIRQLLEGAGDPPSRPCKESDTVQQTGTSNSDATSFTDAKHDAPLEDALADVIDDHDIPEKYLSLFIAETEESLDGLSELLLGEELDDLKALMVICHRIKGAAASIGLHRCATLAHAMEDLVQQLRETSQPLSPEMVDALLAAVDAIRDFTERLRSNGPSGDEFESAYVALKNAAQPVQKEKPEAESAVNREAVAAVRAQLTEEDREAIYAARPAQRPAFAGAVTFASDLPLVGMKASLVCNRLAGLGQLFAVSPSEEELPQLDEVPLLRFGLATNRGKEEVAASLDVDGVVDVLLEELPDDSHSDKETTPAARPAATSPRRVPERRATDRPAETVRVDIDRLDQLMNLTGQLVISKARFSQLCDQLKSMSSRKQSLSTLNGLENRLDLVAGEVDGADAADLDSLRAHVSCLRRDFEMIRGEVEQLLRSRSIVNELSEAVHQLGRVTDGIQKSVMDTRMVPVGPLFSRFKRVIRDITRSNGKSIRLVIRGEKTELDKRMIDELSDPLIHLVRNAADHGIESPADREAAGKPAQGTVTLDAFHRGNQIHIHVSDDGRGLAPDRLRAKAVAKGILSVQDAQRLTDAQTFKLIWEPGFSTAEKITEVSGRGMGMDIVRSKIERINGSIELESEPGRGTTIIIILPLTMAILPSLLTVIRNNVFAIPIESIIEIVRASRRDLATIRGAKTARVRGRIIPIIELDELFQWHSPPDKTQEPPEEWTLVIVGTGTNEIGLAVQDVLGEEDIVIKSLAENYRNVEGLAGASILGNGRVSLILDVPTLIDRASQGYGHTSDAVPVQSSREDDVSAAVLTTA